MMKKITPIFLLVLIVAACSKNNKKQETHQATTHEEVLNDTTKQEGLIAIDSVLLRKSIALKHPSEFKDRLVYTVQIGAFSKPNPKLEADANITTKEEGSLIIYRYGNFDTYKDATAFKKSAQQLYPDAFIVPINKGTRIGIKEALKISNEVVEE